MCRDVLSHAEMHNMYFIIGNNYAANMPKVYVPNYHMTHLFYPAPLH